MKAGSSSGMRVTAAAVAASGVLAAAACSATTVVPAPQLNEHRPALVAQKHTVRMTVEGSDRSASVIFSPGDSHEYGDRKIILPWTKTVTATQGDYVYVSGSDERRGIDMTCNIYVDGKLVATGEPDHNHSLCTASATLR